MIHITCLLRPEDPLAWLAVAVVLAIDAGTTGVRTLAVDASGAVTDMEYRELLQHFPRPGWVEHDPVEIAAKVLETLIAVADRSRNAGRTIAAIGITNQRETVVAWDRSTGDALHRALVWQDRRTAGTCDALCEAGHLPMIRQLTGLVLDPYFSATKMSWLLSQPEVATAARLGRLALGTVDTWVLWNLTGGSSGGTLATDASNASRTMLYDIGKRSWSQDLCDLFGVPASSLAEVRPSCGRFSLMDRQVAPPGSPLAGVPISGIAGDQQAALFGQACFLPGMAKATYGTGTFVLTNLGGCLPEPAEGLLTTVAWDLGERGESRDSSYCYALEGAAFATGATVQWLRDGIGIIAEAAELEPLARAAAGGGGVVVVPAFVGLGSPWWDPYARGVITGISRGTGAAELGRAVVESMAFQVRDVIDAMAATGTAISLLRVDGGVSAMGMLLQIQADQLQISVARPRSTETTAIGAASLAGLAEGLWASLGDLADLWQPDVECVPQATRHAADTAHRSWRSAVERSLGWAQDQPPP